MKKLLAIVIVLICISTFQTYAQNINEGEYFEYAHMNNSKYDSGDHEYNFNLNKLEIIAPYYMISATIKKTEYYYNIALEFTMNGGNSYFVRKDFAKAETDYSWYFLINNEQVKIQIIKNTEDSVFVKIVEMYNDQSYSFILIKNK